MNRQLELFEFQGRAQAGVILLEARKAACLELEAEVAAGKVLPKTVAAYNQIQNVVNKLWSIR